jgi:hypothetical protein
MVSSLLDDLATGARSALEHGYLTRVERPLTIGVEVALHHRVVPRTTVELDGQVVVLRVAVDDCGPGATAHLAHRRWQVVASVAGRTTVRLTWGQVFDRPCWTAVQVARLLGVQPRPCGPGCGVTRG